MTIDMHPWSLALVIGFAIVLWILVAEIAFPKVTCYLADKEDMALMRRIKRQGRIWLAVAMAMVALLMVFSGSGWRTTRQPTSVDREVPREPGRVQYRTSDQPDVTGDGRGIQNEAASDLEEFRNQFLEGEQK